MSPHEPPPWLREQLRPEVVRRRVHLGALVFCGVFAFVVAVVILWPDVYWIGPVRVRLDSLRNPLLELAGAVAVAVATAPEGLRARLRLRGPGRPALRAPWRGWPLGARLFGLALAAKLAASAAGAAFLCEEYRLYLEWSSNRLREPIEQVFRGRWRYNQFESFFARCREELPAGARVLYLGRAEAQLLAYELYPRPVFMHPSDRWVAWVGHQVLDWNAALPPDPLFPGDLPLPPEGPALEAFAASRRLTHLVQFVEGDLRRCRVGALR